MINFYNYLTDKKVSQSLYEMLFDKFMQNDAPTYREYTGTLPVTITANGSDLADWVIYGNTDGVGDKTAQLYDKSDVTTQYNAYLNANGTWVLDSSSRSIKLRCTGNTTYTVTIADSSPIFRISEYNDYDLQPGNSSIILTSIIRGENLSQYTFTTAADSKCLIFQGSFASFDNWINSLMFAESSTALPYEPYGYKITILSNSEPTNIYIDAPLGLNETVSFTDTNVHIPTNNGSTVISCDNTVQPEKMYIKYI